DGDGRDEVIFAGIAGLTGAKIYFDFAADSWAPIAEPFGVIADFNGDGRIDYAGLSGGAAIRLNDGHGHFRLAQMVPGLYTLPVAGDADGDGIVDLVTNSGRDVFIIHGNGDGTFTLPHLMLPGATEALVGDLDGDGDDDLVFANGVAW